MENGAHMTETTAPAEAPEIMGSPWEIFWRRLRRQKLAMAGGVILIFLYAVSLFAGFIAPYGYERMDRARFFHPPTQLRVAGWRLAVQLYEPAAGSSKFKPVPGEVKALRFFVRGEKFKLFAFLPCAVHLFGTGDPDRPVYLLGTDEYGRDILSACSTVRKFRYPSALSASA